MSFEISIGVRLTHFFNFLFRAKGAGGTTYSTTTRLMRGSDLAHEPHEELSQRSEDSPRSFVDPALPKP